MGDGTLRNAKQAHLKPLASSEAVDGGRMTPTTGSYPNYYEGAEWSPDGTCVVTNAADNHIRTFIMYAISQVSRIQHN